MGCSKKMFQLKEIEHLSIKRKTYLDKFSGDANAYLANHQARVVGFDAVFVMPRFVGIH